MIQFALGILIGVPIGILGMRVRTVRAERRDAERRRYLDAVTRDSSRRVAEREGTVPATVTRSIVRRGAMTNEPHTYDVARRRKN